MLFCAGLQRYYFPADLYSSGFVVMLNHFHIKISNRRVVEIEPHKSNCKYELVLWTESDISWTRWQQVGGGWSPGDDIFVNSLDCCVHEEGKENAEDNQRNDASWGCFVLIFIFVSEKLCGREKITESENAGNAIKYFHDNWRRF